MWQALKRIVLGQNSHRVARKRVSEFKGPRGQFQHFNKTSRMSSPAGAAFGAHAQRGLVLQQLQSVMLFKAAGADVLASYKEKYGFHPRVGSSLVEGGGWGVFMQGTAAAGSMVAVYPGLIIRDMRSVDELTYGAVSSALPHRKHVTLCAGTAWSALRLLCTTSPACRTVTRPL